MKPSELHASRIAPPGVAGDEAYALPAESQTPWETLAAEHARLRMLFDFAPDGYLVTDRDGVIRDANRMAMALLGVPSRFLLETPLVTFVHLGDRRRLRTLLNELALGDGVPRSLEVVLVPRRGRPFDAEIRVAGNRELRWMVRDASEQNAARRALAHEVEVRRVAEESMRASEERYRQLFGRLQRRIEEERTRIAREVHDELGAALTAVRFELSLAAREAAQAGAPPDPQIEAIARVDVAIAAMRRICADLRPSLLDHLGLWAAIEWLAEDFAERSGVQCSVDFDERADVRDPRRSTALYRIVQEALTNVLRHAHASEVRIVAREERGQVRIEVSDDGIGIRDADLLRSNALGVLGMQERALACGGEVTFERPQKGTRVVVRFAAQEGSEGCGS